MTLLFDEDAVWLWMPWSFHQSNAFSVPIFIYWNFIFKINRMAWNSNRFRQRLTKTGWNPRSQWFVSTVIISPNAPCVRMAVASNVQSSWTLRAKMKIKSKYPEDCKEQALVNVYNRGDRSIRSIADELNINVFTLKNWMKQTVPTLKTD